MNIENIDVNFGWVLFAFVVGLFSGALIVLFNHSDKR